MIRIWAYYDAPSEYKELSKHGGDEDWVVHIPKEDEARGAVPFEFDDILYGGEDSYLDRWGHISHSVLDNGDNVIIFSHA